jgi:hypothetical protein
MLLTEDQLGITSEDEESLRNNIKVCLPHMGHLGCRSLEQNRMSYEWAVRLHLKELRYVKTRQIQCELRWIMNCVDASWCKIVNVFLAVWYSYWSLQKSLLSVSGLSEVLLVMSLFIWHRLLVCLCFWHDILFEPPAKMPVQGVEEDVCRIHDLFHPKQFCSSCFH